ncbi:unnamed protein product [Prorocentrum cordatum]|uniref:Ubiquitin-like domain-containing protein n=1 Tax=Prorocentrum cordatum TaxID=2364126 RepID=A0ABN9PDS9_9DINO|nr:unnamed protein product [Polarella glacialis]
MPTVLVEASGPGAPRRLQLRHVDPRSSVGELKARVAWHWEVAPCCQWLLRDGRALRDEELVGAHEADPLLLSLSTTWPLAWAELAADLADARGAVVLPALRSAAEMRASAGLQRGDLPHEFIAALAGCLQHPDAAVRDAAVGTMAALGLHGDQPLLALVVELLEHQDRDVRLAAARALGQLAAAGDEWVANAVAARLGAEDVLTRLAAAHALEAVAERGGAGFAAALEARLRDPDRDLRRHAVRALGRLTAPGTPRAAEAAARALEDPDESVREAALEVLASGGPWGSAEGVARRLEHAREEVRAAAARALGAAAARGDACAVEAACSQLAHGDVDVRAAACAALRAAEGRGDRRAVSRAIELSSHPARDVRLLAVQLFGEFAGGGDLEGAEAALVVLTEDSDPDVRGAAVQSLGVAAHAGREPGRVCSRRAAAGRRPFGPPESPVRTGRCCREGRRACGASCGPLPGQRQCWRAAGRGPGAGERGCCRGEAPIAALSTCLDDEDGEVRHAAAHGLSVVSTKFDEYTCDALAARLPQGAGTAAACHAASSALNALHIA